MSWCCDAAKSGLLGGEGGLLVRHAGVGVGMHGRSLVVMMMMVVVVVVSNLTGSSRRAGETSGQTPGCCACIRTCTGYIDCTLIEMQRASERAFQSPADTHTRSVAAREQPPRRVAQELVKLARAAWSRTGSSSPSLPAETMPRHCADSQASSLLFFHYLVDNPI